MPYDDSIVVAGGNSGAKLLSVGRFKVLLGCHKDIRTGIEPQKVAAPLFRQVIGDNIEAFLRQSQPFALHAGSDHLKGLTRTYTMGKQRIIPVQNVCYGIFLMLHELDFRRHTHKADMTAIVLTRPHAVE